MYSSVVTGGYFGLPQLGSPDILALKFGLQKKAMDWRAGVILSLSLSLVAGGATTRCSVERSTSLLQRAIRSPAFTTIVRGWYNPGYHSGLAKCVDAFHVLWEERIGSAPYADFGLPNHRPE